MDALAHWLGRDRATFVAEDDGAIVGTYYLRTNQAGGVKHVCNCGYMTAGAATGQGVARAMCLHSLKQARQLGYRGMQFNFVVSTNARAVALWQSLGFDIVGRIPQAFRHPSLGYVDALVMFRTLQCGLKRRLLRVREATTEGRALTGTEAAPAVRQNSSDSATTNDDEASRDSG